MRIARHSRWMPVFICFLVLPVKAAEWSAEPSVSLRYGYNDNIRLDTLSEDTVRETAVTPSVKFGVATANKGLFGKAYASVRRFSGGSGRNSSDQLDREDYHFDTNAYYGTLRNQFDGIINYTRDSTLDSELDQTGQVISARATRERISLGPSWTHSLTEKTQSYLAYNFSTVSFPDDSGNQNLVEYDYHLFSASLSHQITPRIQGTVASSFSSYQPESGFDSDTVNIQVGLSRSFTETFSTSWLAGYRETTSDTRIATGFCINADPGARFPGCKGGTPVQTGSRKDDRTNTGTVYTANLLKIFERGSARASLSRSTNPSSDGELLDTTRLTLSGNYRLTERLRSDLSVTYSNAETISSVSGNRDKTDEDFFRLRPKLTWRAARYWDIAAEYTYSENKNRNSETANSNAFYLTLVYRPAKMSVSR